jgi:hypothetical protein
MRTTHSIAAFVASVVLASVADKPPDLTGAGPDSFKAHVGQVVTLRGRLEVGKQGYCLWGATPESVWFYVEPEMPPSGKMPPNGIYDCPEAEGWQRLIQKQVRVTGTLRFRSFHRRKESPYSQAAHDYYYMVLQRTQIEALEKH